MAARCAGGGREAGRGTVHQACRRAVWAYSATIFDYYADRGPELLSDRPVPGHAGARIERLPVGPLLGVMPWNYPYSQVSRFAAPNLLAGNTILIKHAENCPTSALAIADLMRDAGVPDGVYLNVFATHDQVAAIIADPRLRGVSLTGSERAGAAVAEAAGRHLKKVVLELGGSDAYIVLDTDDVAAAAERAWATRMANVGQACNSNKRMIVMEDIYDEFVASLVKQASAVAPRLPGEDSDTAYSPMVSRNAAETLLAQVQDAVAKGAVLQFGGDLVSGQGAYFAPAVLTDVTPDMRALPRGALRTGRRGLQGQQRRRGGGCGQRRRLRPGRLRLEHRRGTGGERRRAARGGHDQCQHARW